MDRLTFIDGAVVSVIDLCNSWSKIVQSIKDSHKPVFVCTNDKPEAVVMSLEEFQNMQEIVEAVRREQLGQEMAFNLLEIAQMTGQPIKQMNLNKNGMFEEVGKQ